MSYLIAITGGSGSGKTTLACALRARLGDAAASLLEDDQYYLPRERQGPGAETWSPAECERRINFDSTASKDMELLLRHVAALKAGQAIARPSYDFALHDRRKGAEVMIAPGERVTICEGVHILSDPAIAALFDLKIYVDTPDDLRLVRRIRRDVAERGRELDRVLDQYLRFVRAEHRRLVEPAKYVCDLVIADEGLPAYAEQTPGPAAIERLVAPVWSRLKTDGVVAD